MDSYLLLTLISQGTREKKIIRSAKKRGLSVMTATQMLESMMQNPYLSRAEAADIANAVLDGSDTLMLSGETSIGRYSIEAVRMMSKIIVEAERFSHGR